MTLLIIIVALALIFDYINGFHDAANSIATVVSTKVLTPFQAVVWAAFFNFVAFFIFRDHGVANTIAKTVHEGVNADGIPYITLVVILAGLIAAIFWNLLTWWFGIPSSSSHTLIGGFAGAAIAHTGFESINSAKIVQIASFIVLAPAIGMFIAFLISIWFLHAFKKTILPKLVSLGVIIAIIVFLAETLKTNPEELKSNYESYYVKVIFDSHNFKLILLGFIVTIMALFTLFLNSLNYLQSERWFKRMQLVSSAAFSIGHGGNDAQKVMGIIMAAMVAYDAQTYTLDHMLWWVPLSCYAAISLGTLSGGWKIIKTMGTRITKVTPFEGVAAETAGAITLFLTEFLKIPVSTTHTITGSIIGVGATKRLSAVRWGVTINLLWAWILTIPISALLAMGIYLIFAALNLE
ncbi:MAG: inorganic phosphate transporter [Saprospiraceae bacterium]|jgi:PiT family inorganic phosphate transporter|nr:inorganic phosphate transporter [Saprospiraceae bacterium]MBP6234644.1 inorganic phosphate transporter [Saprospiraceae bacterium]MBP6568609.1 inorganic phosphate transporter [Saprospiraceae bacterium]